MKYKTVLITISIIILLVVPPIYFGIVLGSIDNTYVKKQYCYLCGQEKNKCYFCLNSNTTNYVNTDTTCPEHTYNGTIKPCYIYGENYITLSKFNAQLIKSNKSYQLYISIAVFLIAYMFLLVGSSILVYKKLCGAIGDPFNNTLSQITTIFKNVEHEEIDDDSIDILDYDNNNDNGDYHDNYDVIDLNK